MVRKADIFSNSVFFILLIATMIVVFASLFIPLFISDDTLRARMSSYLSSRSGLDIQIEGDLRLTMFPNIHIRAKDVSVLAGEYDLVKRSPLTIRSLSMRISYFRWLTGGIPSSVQMSSPTFYVKRIDLKNERWELLNKKPDSAVLLGEKEYIEELWHVLYRVCNVHDDKDAWRSGAEKALVEGDMSVAGDQEYINILLDTVCPEVKAPRTVYKNWNFLFADIEENPVDSDMISTPYATLEKRARQLPDTFIVESASVIYDAFDEIYRRDLIDVKVDNDDIITVSGSVSGQRLPINFELSSAGLSEGNETELSIYTEDILALSLKGTMQPHEDDIALVFDGGGEISDPSQLSALFLSETGFFRNIGYDKPITVSASGHVNDKGAELSDIVFVSDVLNGSMTAALRSGADNESDGDITVTSNISNIDIDNILDNAQSNKIIGDFGINTQGDGLHLPQMKLTLPKLFAFHLDIEADDIRYREKMIDNFAVEADIYSTRASLHRLEVTLPGNTKSILDGYVKHNGIRPLFIGNLSASGERLREVSTMLFPEITETISDDLMRDFSFKTGINMTPVSMALNDMLLTFDNASLRGDITTDYVDTTSAMNISLILDRFDFDAYGLTPYVLNKARDISRSDLRKSDNIEAYIKRNIGTQLQLALKAEDARFNDTKIRRAEVVASVTPGVFNIDKFIIEDGEVEASRKFDVNAYMRLSTPQEGNPKLAAYWKSDFLNTRLLSFESTAEENSAEYSWQERIPYYMLDRFEGPITLSVDNFFDGDNKIGSNIYVKAHTKSKTLTIPEMRGRFYGRAHIAARAQASLGRVTSLGVSYTMARLPLLRISQEMPEVFGKRISGDLNIQGKLQASGIGLRQMRSKINVQGKFKIKGLRIENMDLKHIFSTALNTISVVDMRKAIRHGFNTGITDFDTVRGDIETLRTREPYQIQLKNVLLQTPYSLSSYAVNYNAVSNAYRSVFNFGFRPEEDTSVKLVLSSQQNSDGSSISNIDDTEVIEFVTQKTEGLR